MNHVLYVLIKCVCVVMLCVGREGTGGASGVAWRAGTEREARYEGSHGSPWTEWRQGQPWKNRHSRTQGMWVCCERTRVLNGVKVQTNHIVL